MAAAVCVLAGLSLWRASSPGRHPQFAAPRTVRTRSGGIERTLRVSGTIASNRIVTFLAPRMRGSRTRQSLASGDFSLTLLHMAKSGARVHSGDVAAEFDTHRMAMRLDDFRAEVEQRREVMRGIEARLDVRRTALQQRIRVARGNIEKAALNLRTAPVRSAIQAERFRIAHEEAGAELGELLVQERYFDDSERALLRREQLAQQIDEFEFKKAESNLERMVFRSPIEGIVIPGDIQRGSEPGEVAPGDEFHSGHPFLRVVDVGDLRLDATVNQADIEHLHAGARARVHVDLLPALEIPGHLLSVGVTSITSRYRPTYVSNVPVRIQLDRVAPLVLPNVSASADIILDSEQSPAIVPRECVFDGRAFVHKGDRWEAVPVELGLANHTEVAVREGLVPGQEIACELPALALR